MKLESTKAISTNLNILTSIVIFGFFAALLKAYITGVYYPQEIWPYNNFLFQPGDFMRDFLLPYLASRELNPYGSGEAYFPFAFIITFFYTLVEYKYAQFLYIISACIIILYFNYRFILKNQFSSERFNSFLALSLFSYPILFCIDRGNLEVFILLFAVLFYINFNKRNFNRASFLLTLAVLIKPYMALFYFMFLFKREYFHFLKAIILFFIMFFIFISFFKGSIVDNLLMLETHMSKAIYFEKITLYTWYSSSFSEIVKLFVNLTEICTSFCYGILENEFFALLSKFINASLILFSLFMCFTRKYSEPILILILTILVISATPVAYDYKLIMLYLPIYAFLNETNEIDLHNSKIPFILIGTILIPKAYYFLDGHLATSISTFINPLLLLILLFYSLIMTGKKNNF